MQKTITLPLEQWGDVCACMDTLIRMFQEYGRASEVQTLRIIRRNLTSQLNIPEGGSTEQTARKET